MKGCSRADALPKVWVTAPSLRFILSHSRGLTTVSIPKMDMVSTWEKNIVHWLQDYCGSLLFFQLKNRLHSNETNVSTTMTIHDRQNVLFLADLFSDSCLATASPSKRHALPSSMRTSSKVSAMLADLMPFWGWPCSIPCSWSAVPVAMSCLTVNSCHRAGPLQRRRPPRYTWIENG